MRSQVVVGIFEMLAVTAIWGSVPVIFKLSGLPSPVFVFFRVAITAVLLAATLRRFACGGLTAVLSGVFLALNWIFLFYATALMPVSTAVMIYYAGPIMASVYMHFLGEKMQRPKLLALLISFTGVALLVGFASYVTPLGVLFAVLSATFYAALIVASKLSAIRMAPIHLVLCQTSVATFFTAPFLALYKFEATPSALVAVFIAATVNTLLALFLWYDALRRITVQLASALSYLDPVYASIFAFLFLGQTSSQWTAVGGALVILGGIMSIYAETRADKPGIKARLLEDVHVYLFQHPHVYDAVRPSFHKVDVNPHV
jgi:drug/metabolite transporter (DMT)-like permease